MSDENAMIVLVLAALLGRFIALPPLTLGATRLLERRWFPVVIGLISAVFFAIVWGGLNQVAVIHDEAAYLLQARLYASGHWTAPGLPMPEFFEQYHVLVTPVLTAKYFPGHAIMLVPGIWLGLPGLMPVLMLGLCGALTFEVSRRLTNPWVGLIAWLLWMTAPGVVSFMSTYLSESTSSAFWMLGWLGLLLWLEDGKQRWLVMVAVSIGIGFLTRPLTMLVFAIPIGIVVLVRVARRSTWSELIVPFGIGFAFLGIWLLWCWRTTGNPLHTPWEIYRREYIPDDRMGFGLSGQHPLRPLNSDMVKFNDFVVGTHRDYTLASVPKQFCERVLAIAENMWATRATFLLLAALALITTSGAFWFATGTSLLLVVTYLAYAHFPKWSVYYIEIQPVLAFATAVAWWRFESLIANRKLAWPLRSTPSVTPNAVFAMMLSTVLLMPYITRRASWVAEHKFEGLAYHTDFRDLLAMAPGDRIVVFVRFALHHSAHKSLVTNVPDLASARVWTVYDRGADNLRLMKLDPHRKPYLFDEEHRVLLPLDSAGTPDYEHAIHEPDLLADHER